MADYAISNVARRVVYTNTGVGPYSFTFEVLANTDIAVYRGSTLLTLTTDYTVIINANGTGSVTLVLAGTGNITIVGARAIQRTSDYTTGGDLFASTLNTDLDSQTIYAQQVAETAERGLKAPVVDPTDINMTLPAKASRVGTVLAFNATTGNPEAGPSIASVTTVAAQSANINTVATNIASVNTVAGNISNVNTVAGVSSNVTTVAGSISNVNTVADDLNEGVSEINTVAVNIANVNTVGTNIANVNTVAGISANVTSVAGNSSNINTVAGISGNVTTVAGISANVTTVAGINSDVTAVAADATDIGAVASNIANVNTVAGNSTNINTVAGISANVTTVAGISSNVTTVATNNANVTTVAGISANVTTVAGISANVTIAATNVADINNFADVYQGAKATDPSLRNDGSALQSGDLYFNTTDDVMKVREAGAWLAAYASVSGALIAVNNLSDLTSNSTARTNLGLGTIATQAASNVAITGGTINGTTIGATTASTGAFTSLTDSGNLTFTSTGNRILGDFSNSTQSNRVAFQTSTANSATSVNVLPNGTSTTAVLRTFNNSDPTNAAEISIFASSSTNSLISGITGTGTYLPLTMLTGGSERLRIDTSGNVGIGTSSPSSYYKPNLVVNSASSTGISIVDTSATLAMIAFGSGSTGTLGGNSNRGKFWYDLAGDSFNWNTSGAGSLTPQMRIDSSGNVAIGTTTFNQKLTIGGINANNNTNQNSIEFQDNNGNPNFRLTGGRGANGNEGYGVFSTSTGGVITERMRIDSSGNLLVNATSSTGHKMTVQSAAGAGGIDCVGGATNGYYAMRVDMPSTNTYGVLFRNNGNNVGDIRINSSTTTYNTSSDYRLKENIAPMTGALDKVSALKPVTYKWKSTGEESQGFIAHELQAVVPDCVTGEKDAVDEEGNPQYQGIDTSFLVATLTAAIQELNEKVDAQAVRIAELESK
jgi:hypothetical protein